MNNPFNNGDRVTVIKDHPDGNFCITSGMQATVVWSEQDDYCVGLEFDVDVNGGSVYGCCEDGKGWWVPFEDVVLSSVFESEEEIDGSADPLSMFGF